MELVENLSCHADNINCIVLLAKGNKAITASTDKCIKLWDLTSQKLLASQEGAHNSAVTNIFLTIDNQCLISASATGSAKLWRVGVQSLEQTAEIFPEGSFQHISFCPAKDILAMASKEGNFYIWKLLEQKTDLISEGSSKEKLSVIFLTKDGSRIVFGGADEPTIHIRDLSKIKEFSTLKYPENKTDSFEILSKAGGSRKISDVDSDMQSKMLAVGFTDGTVEVWSLDDYTPLCKLHEQFKGFELRVAFCAPYKLAMSTKDRVLKIINLQTQECELKYDKIHKETISNIAVQPETGIISTCSKDRTFRIYSFQTKKVIASFSNPHERALNSVVVSPQGNTFVTCSSDTSIKLWSLYNCLLLNKIKNAHENSVSTIAVSENGKHLASSSPDKSIKLWNFETFKLVYTWSLAHSQFVNQILITPDSEKILSASSDNTIKIWSIASKNLIHTFKQVHIHDVLSMAITPDGEYVISGSSNKSIKVLSLTTYNLYHTFEDPDLYMTGALAVTKDSSTFVSASFDRSIRLWDLKNKELTFLIEKAHADVINSLVIIEKFGVVASGGSDHHIKFWDLVTYKLLHTINNAHTYRVKCLDISPNNTFMVSVSSDKSIKVWNISVLGVWIKGTSQTHEISKLIKVKSSENLDEMQYERYKQVKETLSKQTKIIENMTNEYRNKIYFANKVAKVTATMDTNLTAGDYSRTNECRIELKETQNLLLRHGQNFISAVEQFVNAEENIDPLFLEFLRNLKGYVSKEEHKTDELDDDPELKEKARFRGELKELEQHCDRLSSVLVILMVFLGLIPVVAANLYGAKRKRAMTI